MRGALPLDRGGWGRCLLGAEQAVLGQVLLVWGRGRRLWWGLLWLVVGGAGLGDRGVQDGGLVVTAVVSPGGHPCLFLLLLLLGQEALQVGAGQPQRTLCPKPEGDWAGAGGAQAPSSPHRSLHSLPLLLYPLSLLLAR